MPYQVHLYLKGGREILSPPLDKPTAEAHLQAIKKCINVRGSDPELEWLAVDGGLIDAAHIVEG